MCLTLACFQPGYTTSYIHFNSFGEKKRYCNSLESYSERERGTKKNTDNISPPFHSILALLRHAGSDTPSRLPPHPPPSPQSLTPPLPLSTLHPSPHPPTSAQKHRHFTGAEAESQAALLWDVLMADWKDIVSSCTVARRDLLRLDAATRPSVSSCSPSALLMGGGWGVAVVGGDGRGAFLLIHWWGMRWILFWTWVGRGREGGGGMGSDEDIRRAEWMTSEIYIYIFFVKPHTPKSSLCQHAWRETPCSRQTPVSKTS